MAKDERRWDQGTSDRSPEGFRPSGKQIGAGVVLFVLVVFVLQNTQTTTITMLVLDVSFPLWLVLALTILLSMGVGYVLGGRGKTRKS